MRDAQGERDKMTLQGTLRKFKEEVINRVGAADAEIMEKATAELARSGSAQRAKKAGERAPDFALANTNGELVRLSDLLVRGPVVLTFYRGVW